MSQQWPNAIPRRTQVRRAAQRADGLARSRVSKHGLAEPEVDVGGGCAVARILDAQPEHFLTLAHLAERDARATEQAERFGDQRAGVGVEHLPVGRAQENGERRRPGAEQLQNSNLVALGGGGFGLRHAAQLDRATRCGTRQAIQLFTHVRAQARSKRADRVSFLDAIVQEQELRAFTLDGQLTQRVAVQRREQ